jgi:subtilase family serine protease
MSRKARLGFFMAWLGATFFMAANAVATDKPDVSIYSIAAERVETLAVPLRVNVTVVTKNGGRGYAQHFNCRLSYRRSSSAPWQSLDMWHRDGLYPGQTFSHVTQRDFSEGGTYYFKAEADCDAELAESSEGNNIHYCSKSFSAGIPDLVVSNLSATIKSVNSSGTWSVKVEFDLENKGAGKAEGSFVTVLKVSRNNGSYAEVQRYTTSNLNKDQKKHYTKTSSYSGATSLKFEVRADDTHMVHESDENNNIAYSETLRH